MWCQMPALHFHPFGILTKQQHRPALQEDENFIRKKMPFQFDKMILVKPRGPVQGRECPLRVAYQAAEFRPVVFKYI